MNTLTLAAETVEDLSLSLEFWPNREHTYTGCRHSQRSASLRDSGQDVNTLTLAAEAVVDLSLSGRLAKT